MNPLTKIPAELRYVLYIVYGLGSVLITYLGSQGVLGVEEISMWTGVGAVFGVTAAGNVDWRDKEDGEHRA